MLLLSRTLIVLLLLVGLVGCTRLSFTAPLPTIGPVTQVSGRSGATKITFTTSTNCAEVGETVVITGRIVSEATYPLSITTQPTIDFIVRPANWSVQQQGSEPVQRWSETTDYPVNVPTVLSPGEERVYTWNWVADPIYERRVVQIQFWIGQVQLQNSFIPEGGSSIGVGVAGMPGGESVQVIIPCEEFPQK